MELIQGVGVVTGVTIYRFWKSSRTPLTLAPRAIGTRRAGRRSFERIKKKKIGNDPAGETNVRY